MFLYLFNIFFSDELFLGYEKVVVFGDYVVVVRGSEDYNIRV